MKIEVKHDPQEHWYFNTPKGGIWLSAWGNGIMELHNYFHTQQKEGCDKSNELTYTALKKMFQFSK